VAVVAVPVPVLNRKTEKMWALAAVVAAALAAVVAAAAAAVAAAVAAVIVAAAVVEAESRKQGNSHHHHSRRLPNASIKSLRCTQAVVQALLLVQSIAAQAIVKTVAVMQIVQVSQRGARIRIRIRAGSAFRARCLPSPSRRAGSVGLVG
jgi:hypothetical protein